MESGENYWFSPIASLNQEAGDRAKSLSAAEVDAEIATLIRAEERYKGMGFLRVHGAPDDPLRIEDAYEAVSYFLVINAECGEIFRDVADVVRSQHRMSAFQGAFFSCVRQR
jgi:hypothetical protein